MSLVIGGYYLFSFEGGMWGVDDVSHILACCCVYQALDESCDRWVVSFQFWGGERMSVLMHKNEDL